MKNLGFILLGVGGLFLLATYALQSGISKEERKDPDKYKLDATKRRRLQIGYYCTFGFLAFAAAGGLLIATSSD